MEIGFHMEHGAPVRKRARRDSPCFGEPSVGQGDPGRPTVATLAPGIGHRNVDRGMTAEGRPRVACPAPGAPGDGIVAVAPPGAEVATRAELAEVVLGRRRRTRGQDLGERLAAVRRGDLAEHEPVHPHDPAPGRHRHGANGGDFSRMAGATGAVHRVERPRLRFHAPVRGLPGRGLPVAEVTARAGHHRVSAWGRIGVAAHTALGRRWDRAPACAGEEAREHQPGHEPPDRPAGPGPATPGRAHACAATASCGSPRAQWPRARGSTAWSPAPRESAGPRPPRPS